MKKTISQAVCMMGAMCVLVSTPVASAQQGEYLAAANQANIADDVMKKVEESLAKAGKLLPYLKEYTFKTVTVDKERANIIFVQLRKEKDQEKPMVNMQFEANSGKLINFRLDEKTQDGKIPTWKESKEKATAFLKEWYGADMDGYQLNPTFTEHHGVVFSKSINGLLYPNLSVGIELNAKGEVVSGGSVHVPDSEFSYETPSFEKTSFPQPKEALSKEQMTKTVASHLKLTYWADKKLLTYEPMFSGYLDATTGKPLDVPQQKYNLTGELIKVTPQAKKLTAKTKEDVSAYVKQEHNVDIKAGEWEEESFPKTGVKAFIWKEDTDDETEVKVMEKTGEILSFSKQVPRIEKNSMTREEARARAIKEMEKYVPTDMGEMMEISDTSDLKGEERGRFQFEFVKMHQGIPVNDRSFYVCIVNGKVTSMGTTSETDFVEQLPDLKAGVTAEQAAQEYLKQFQLEYFYPENNGNQAVLVYKLASEYRWFDGQIDASTGKIIQDEDKKTD
ncbi:YcdB/YcdC domain-containing protein [Brevibacillus sp. NPDC003359]|uniref:YcdB/YcdC domain-containing protein n=1 Tax=unclassified Brevibacillus TaxID=2684853 RepID=UPI0036D09206